MPTPKYEYDYPTLPTPKYEFGKIERAIIDYVTKHDGCTKNAVKTELNNKKDKNGKRISLSKTTDLRINRLIQLGVLEYNKKGKGFYHLRLSDRNPYVAIKKEIEKIELYYQRIYEPLKELDELSRGAGSVGVKMMYMKEFVKPCFESIFIMLKRLRVLSNDETKISVVDSHDLNTKIDSVMHKISKQSEASDRELLKSHKKMLTQFRNKLSRPSRCTD